MNMDIKKMMVDMKRVKKDCGQDSLSVEEVLNLPALDGYKLLGGASGLQRRCKHITILETPTGINWLEGEEFLMTAGYAFINNEKYKEIMLIDAHKKDLSAIAIKENRYFGDISQDLIKQANELDLPLVQLPSNVIYTRVISSFYDMLFYRKNEYLLKLNNIYKKLLDLSFENKNIEGIIYTISNLSNSNVFLLDDSLKLMCFNIVDFKKFNKISCISPFNKKGIQLIYQIKDQIIINKNLKDFFISFYPIIVDGENIAYVYIINYCKPDQLSQRAIEYGISLIAAKLKRDRNMVITQAKVNKTLVKIMLNDDALPEEFYDNVELNLNWENQGFIYGICIRLNFKENKKVENYEFVIYNYLDNALGENCYLSTNKDDNIFVFLKVDNKDHLKKIVSNLMKYIETYEDISIVSIGISNPYKDIKSIKRLYNEAYLANFFSNYNIVYYDSLNTIKLLYPLKDDKDVQQYYDETIKKIEEYDKKNGTQFLETLETYFKYNLKKTLVADKLFIHVETLRYRLNRIEEITGYSVEETEGLFALQMGLKIRSLLQIK